MRNRNHVLGLAVALLGTTSLAGAADASHFRGAALVPSIDANGTLTINSTSFWRQSPGTSVCTFPHDCVATSVFVNGPGGFSNSSPSIGSQTQDLSDSRRAEVNEVFSFDLSGQQAGVYRISWSGSSWVSGVPNANGSYGTTSHIFWDGQNATTPILFNIENIQQEVNRNTAYSDNLDAIAATGLTLSYSAPLANGMSSQPTGYSISGTGQQQITAAGTAAIGDNPSNPGADVAFSGLISASDGSDIEFVWLFDAVNQSANNLAPIVDDLVVNALVGDTISETITGTDPDGDPLTWLLAGFQGPGNPNVPGATFDPNTQAFSWNSTGFVPGTYIASFQASDGSLTDIGTLRINLSTNGQTPQVSEPATLAMFGLSLAAAGAFVRRRRNDKPS